MLQPRIRTQAYLVGAVPLAFLLALLALSLTIQARSQAGAALEQRTQVALARVDRIRSLLGDASRLATGSRVGTAAQVGAVRRAIDDELRTLQSESAGQRTVQTRISALGALLGVGMDIIDRYTAARRAGDVKTTQAIQTAPATRALSLRLNTAFDTLINAERTSELVALNDMRAESSRFEIALIVVCVFGIVLTLLLSGRFGLGIARRLGLLAENARRLARGEPTAPLLGNDEFTDLDLVYQAMMRRIAHEHRIATALQRTLLPQTLPAFDGVRIDTSYLPAAKDADVGGDWYDAFEIDERCICISMGDVAGHGLRAAAVMAEARLAVRTAARMERDPARIMAHLNRVLCADEPGTLVSAVIAMFDVDDGTMQYAIAGHPEPLVVRADGEVRLLDGRGMILGVFADTDYQTFHAQLHEGWALVLYTDGLVEVSRDYLSGLKDLRGAASAEFTSSAANIAEAIQERVIRKRHAADDAAVLFIGITRLGAQRAAGRRRTWVLDARDGESAHRAKRAILWHLGNQIQNKERVASIELILGELIGNVARHSPGPAEVSVEQRSDRILLRVADRGLPFPFNGHSDEADPFAESGRGLFLVRCVSQDVRVEHTGSGNVVTAVVSA